jgi:hypothetical protein
MKTAEKIIEEHGWDDSCTPNYTKEIEEAMEEYASQFKPKYPKKMLVWVSGGKENELTVIAELNGYYITVSERGMNEAYPSLVDLDVWPHAKDI